MLIKDNGFAWIETMMILQVLVIVALTIIPIFSILTQEKLIITERTIVMMKLHDELQRAIYEGELERNRFTESIDQRIVHFTFDYEHELIKGCAIWENAKNRDEQFCLYGMAEQ